jgi:hypothetical protein
MIVKPQVVTSLFGALKYMREDIAANGNLRPSAPITFGDPEELLLDVAASRPSTRPFAVIISYHETLKEVGVDVIRSESRQYLEACAGGVSLRRFPWLVSIHARTCGCDAHLIAIPFDLYTGLVLPLFCRERTMVELNELLPRRWDLQRGRASPGDWWRRKLETPPAKAMSPAAAAWFVATDAAITDGLRAGIYGSREEVIDALRDAGARVEAVFFTHIVILYANKTYTLRGGKYSGRFDFDTFGGCAGAVPRRDPAACGEEIAKLDVEISALVSVREATFRRFGRERAYTVDARLPHRIAAHLRQYRAGLHSQSAQHIEGDRNYARNPIGVTSGLAKNTDSSSGYGAGIDGALVVRPVDGSRNKWRNSQITGDPSGPGGGVGGLVDENSGATEIDRFGVPDPETGWVDLGDLRKRKSGAGDLPTALPSSAVTVATYSLVGEPVVGWATYHFQSVEEKRKKHEREHKEFFRNLDGIFIRMRKNRERSAAAHRELRTGTRHAPGAEPRPAGVPGGLADAGPKPVRRDGNPLVEPGRENCGDERPNRRRELGQRRSRAAFARLYSQHASAVHNFAAAFRALSPLRTSAPRSGFVGESDQEMEVML